MSTDEYVPDDDQVESAYIDFESEPTSRLTDDNLLTREEAQARWSRWLAAHDARVRRDAAREALDGLIDAWLGKYGTPETRDAGIAVRDYRETNYRLPEEAP